MKLLIVEDNSQMRDLIKSVVQEYADKVFECADGSEVFAAYREHRPDWVLMDIEMEQMDGIAASRLLLESFPEARIVILTNYNDSHLRESAGAAGVCGYVLKENLLELKSILTSPEVNGSADDIEKKPIPGRDVSRSSGKRREI